MFNTEIFLVARGFRYYKVVRMRSPSKHSISSRERERERGKFTRAAGQKILSLLKELSLQHSMDNRATKKLITNNQIISLTRL